MYNHTNIRRLDVSYVYTYQCKPPLDATLGSRKDADLSIIYHKRVSYQQISGSNVCLRAVTEKYSTFCKGYVLVSVEAPSNCKPHFLWISIKLQ